MRRVTAIINPMARNGRLGRGREVLIRSLHDALPGVEVLATTVRGHASHLATEFGSDEDDTVIAVGGDGTINEVATGLVAAGARATMGVLPAGTGNDFAFALGMTPGPQALDVLAAGHVRAVDYGTATSDGRTGVFLNAVGVGFDALSAVYAYGLKYLPGSMAYTAAVLRALLQWRSPEATIDFDDGSMQLTLMFVSAGNGPRSGGGFLLSPEATPFDGMLDACVVRDLSLYRALRIMPRTRTGGHVSEPEARMVRSSGFRIRTARPVPVHLDGEILTVSCTDLSVETHPGGLRMIVPKT